MTNAPMRRSPRVKQLSEKVKTPYTTNYGPIAGVNPPKKKRIAKTKKDEDMPSFDLGIPSTQESPATQEDEGN